MVRFIDCPEFLGGRQGKNTTDVDTNRRYAAETRTGWQCTVAVVKKKTCPPQCQCQDTILDIGSVLH